MRNILPKWRLFSIMCMPHFTALTGRFTDMSAKSSNIAPLLFPLGLLIIAMISIQSGASLAKSLFPVVGAQGTTALRLIFASLILLLVLRPWRARLTARSLRTVMLYGISLGSMNMLFYMSLQTVPLGIAVALEFTGPLAVALWASRKLIDFLWVALAVIGLLLLIPIGESSTVSIWWEQVMRWELAPAGRPTLCSGRKPAQITAFRPQRWVSPSQPSS